MHMTSHDEHPFERSAGSPARFARLSFRQKALILLGSLGPLGFLPASGTMTVALVGLPLFWLAQSMSLSIYIPAILGFSLVAVWIHQQGDRVIGEKDSRLIVWDELVGILVAVTAVPFSWQTALTAFAFERAFDIAKIQPARWVEDHAPGGWGVVGDDVVAGLYTLAVLHALITFAPGLMGHVTG